MSSPEYAELVRFLGQRFSTIDQRFDAIDPRFDVIDQRFATIDRRFDAIDQRFVAMDAGSMRWTSQAITQALRRIEGRLVDERTRREMLERDLGHFDEICRRLERLEQTRWISGSTSCEPSCASLTSSNACGLRSPLSP
jgi:hypothetical protein